MKTIAALWDFLGEKGLQQEYIDKYAEIEAQKTRERIQKRMAISMERKEVSEGKKKEYQAKYYLRRTKPKRHGLLSE